MTDKTRTEYVYDGRGSVAAELSYNTAWYTLGGALSDKSVITKSYTPFGEQLTEEASGFGYNGEYYNATTGMVYLRARFYEPAMNRFSQKDIVRGSITNPNSLNRYSYVQNDPINFVDPSGESLKSAWNSAKNAVTNAVTKAVNGIKNVANKAISGVKNFFGGGSKPTSSAGSASNAIVSNTQTGSGSGGSNTTYLTGSGSSSGRNSGNSKLNSSNPTVKSQLFGLCSNVLDSKSGQTMLNLWWGYDSFKNGMTSAIIRKCGQEGIALDGVIDLIFTGKTRISDSMQKGLNSKIDSLKEDSHNDALYTTGMIAGDIAGIAFDIWLAVYTAGSSAVTKTAGREALVLATDATVAAGVAVEAGSVIDALWQSTNLGKDIDNLISQIKEKGDYDTEYYQRGKTEVPKDSELIRRDKANVKSEEFKEFIREEDGYFRGNEWKKYMETWETSDGEYIEVHYWKNTKTGEIWSHK